MAAGNQQTNSTHITPINQPVTAVIKRIMDIAGGLLGLGFTILIGPFIALCIWVDTRTPILYAQERIGKDAVAFTLYKFRSMVPGADMDLDLILDLDKLEQPAFKLEEDPRVTRIGRFLRRWSLDELPQFWNVLKGEMSLVGPRPEETRVVALYNDWHRKRLLVKPGMTGPMQINGRGNLTMNERMALEIAYIEQHTLRNDFAILLRTIPTIIRGDGAR